MGYVIIGGLVVFGLALLTDPSQTIKLSASIITIRGATFLAQKITENENKTSSQIINVVGWCLTGISVIALLKLSTAGLTTVADSFQKTKDTFTSIGLYFENFAQMVDKIAFWNK